VNRLACIATLLVLSSVSVTRAQKPPLLPEKDVAALANELSGETAKRNLEGLARFDRQRGSKGFDLASELVAERLRAYGLSDVAILQFPADGKAFYGTQRSRPAWDADFAELWEVTGDKRLKLASYEAEPVVLAEDSESADLTADLVDVGAGTKESDYTGKDVKGKLVLVGAQPGAVQDLAVGKLGAAGIVSYAQNQKTAWSGENQEAIRWGHLETFSPNKTFAFMVSLKTARAFHARLAAQEKITLHAAVKAGQHPGFYEIVTATIPGSDPKLKNEEIIFSCHLDHQRPGANDNASGCATILEVARTLRQLTLIGGGELQPPARTIRFVFPPEIEGTMALLNGTGRSRSRRGESEPGKEKSTVSDGIFHGPEFAKGIKAVIHMDMVGGGPETKSVFHVTRGPMSLPSFVHDVAWAFADWLNGQSYQFAATGEAAYPMVAPEGGKEALGAEYSAYTPGSDHDVYQDSSTGIPAIYLNDWPDRFIHTNFDSAANIDPTKLKRAAFIGAASGYFLAAMNEDSATSVLLAIDYDRLLRARLAGLRREQVPADESANLIRHFLNSEIETSQSLHRLAPNSSTSSEPAFERFFPVETLANRAGNPPRATGSGLAIFRRKTEPKGPLTVFGYDYFADHAKSAGIPAPKLLDYQGLWGSGEEYAYEVLNFPDGKRTAQEIRDAVSAEYGPIPLELVVEYLQALEKIGLLEQVK
jgi:aminopeptidase YwaD